MIRSLMTSGIIAACGVTAAAQAPAAYPTAPKADVTDTYFGHSVADPYRPLEDDRAAATLEWVKAENALTRSYLDTIASRPAVRARLAELYDYKRTSLPSRGNDGRIYITINDGTQPQAVVYVTDSLGGNAPMEVFIDPNTLSADGTVALKSFNQSPDGSLTAYIISRNGSDWAEIYVMETATRRLLSDHIERAKFTTAEWRGNEGFFYSAYPAPPEGDELKGVNEGHNVYFHKLGTSQADDTIAFADPANPLHFHNATIFDKADALFVTVGGQGLGNGLLMKRLNAPDAPWAVITATQEKEVLPLAVKNERAYFLTNAGADRYRIVSAPLDNPAPENWTELVAEAEGVLENAIVAGDRLILLYTRDASNHVEIRSLADGSLIRNLPLDKLATVGISAGDTAPDELFFSLISFTSPATIYAHNLADGTSERLISPDIKGFNPDDYVTEQVWVTSSDGTRLPMFITYRRGLKRDGDNPVYLTAYGGFNKSMNPSFAAGRLLLLEKGYILAQASLRGGGEYGEPWHVAGTKMQKLNVFNDFIACGEWLVKEGWTKPSLIAIEGGSNGGLLVGAVVNMRPDLWAVAIPRVGVMDMMRYHLFTIGWNWAPDYGRSDDSPEMAEYLLAYSPMHNISNDGTPYPAILATTADHDDRVVPAHSFKYAATLQASDTGSKPKLIRIDSNAGHGAGKSTAKTIDELTDIYTFIFNNLPR